MNAPLLAGNLAAHWVQAGVLSIVLVSAIRLLRVKEPRLRLALFHLLLILIVFLPWLQRWQVREQPASLVSSQITTTTVVEIPAPLATAMPAAPARMRIDPAILALCIIAAGIVLRFAWLLLGFVRLRRFARQSERIAPPETAEDVQVRVGAAARYLQHPTAGSPSTFGIFRPQIVLPARFSNLSAAHQESALCHELIHVRRHDVAAALAEELLMAALWFHPWVWSIRRGIRVAREQVVDLHVLALTGDRAEYVRCLIEMSGHDLMPHLSQAGAAMVRSNELRARVDAIFQEVRMSRLRLVAVSAILAAVMGAAAWIGMGQAPLYAMAEPTLLAAPAVRAAVTTAQQTISRQAVEDAQARDLRERAAQMRLAIEKWQAQQATQPATAVPNQMRRLIKVAYADYPSDALDKEISGTVKATIVVDAAGEVTMVDMTSGPVELRSSAFKSLMGLKYSPGAETVRINVAMEYRLDPQGWGVRVVQDSASIGNSITIFSPGLRGELAPNLGVPIRVGGEVAAPKKIKDMAPVYPPVALGARVQGIVILEAMIDAAGNVTDAKVVRSIPLLDQAAIDAVKQWQYTPTLLNDTPVPVIMTVTVNFALRNEIVLRIGLPTGDNATFRGPDDGRGITVNLPNGGKFVLTPSKGSSPTGRSIAVYQTGDPGSPAKLLGNLQVELNGGMVQTPTTPSFGVELVAIP
jgi:TonB family protein